MDLLNGSRSVKACGGMRREGAGGSSELDYWEQTSWALLITSPNDVGRERETVPYLAGLQQTGDSADTIE